jgi:hypothetical protein
MMKRFIVGGSMVWLGGILWVLHDQLTLETKQSQFVPGTALVGAGLALLLE